MECKICGYRARDIASMARHYRSKHPGGMKRKSRAALRYASTGNGAGSREVLKILKQILARLEELE